jgi:hypothetical protein
MLNKLPASDNTEVYDDARSSPVVDIEAKAVEVVPKVVEVVEVVPQPSVVIVERPVLCFFTRWFSR